MIAEISAFFALAMANLGINKEKDSLRYYFLGKNWQRRVEHVGAKTTYVPEGFLMV